jgi:hypothetical protein
MHKVKYSTYLLVVDEDTGASSHVDLVAEADEGTQANDTEAEDSNKREEAG